VTNHVIALFAKAARAIIYINSVLMHLGPSHLPAEKNCQLHAAQLSAQNGKELSAGKNARHIAIR
jgi:hypothetical protein